MDEVLQKFEFSLFSHNSAENKQSNFDGMYKNWGKFGNQEQRRKDILEVQRGNRNDSLDKLRGILELVNPGDDDEDVYKSERAPYRPSIYVAGFTKTERSYSKVLMMSEWMIEKPEDFNEKWLVSPCPKGMRTLVVATQGLTKCYSKLGYFRHEWYTALPGGSPCKTGQKQKCTILDCFYIEKTKTMYVLDVLAWNNMPMTDGETDFRQYWLRTQMSELPQLQKLTEDNQLIFKLLPKVPCDKKSFNEFMMKMPHFPAFNPGLDGLLFYHKHAHYFAGQTPLVGWLYPFMVPEILGRDVTVNPGYLAQMPVDYIGQAHYIQSFEAKAEKKRNKRKSNSMDTTPVETDEMEVK